MKNKSLEEEIARDILSAVLDEYYDHKTCGHNIECVVWSDPLEKKIVKALKKVRVDAGAVGYRKGYTEGMMDMKKLIDSLKTE